MRTAPDEWVEPPVDEGKTLVLEGKRLVFEVETLVISLGRRCSDGKRRVVRGTPLVVK